MKTGVRMNITVLHQELNMIQECIKRMANNSFMMKGWYIALISVGTPILFKFEVNSSVMAAFLLGVSIAFWWLDAFYLKLENLFRAKYRWIIRYRKYTDLNLYDLNPHNSAMWLAEDKKCCQRGTFRYMFRKSTLPVYIWGIVLVTIYWWFS